MNQNEQALAALREHERQVELISNIITYGFDILLLVVTVIFITILIRRFNLLVFQTQRVSETAQHLLVEIKKATNEAREIKNLLAPHYIQQDPNENYGGEQPPHER